MRSQSQLYKFVAGGRLYLSRLSLLFLLLGVNCAAYAQSAASQPTPQEFWSTLVHQSSPTEIERVLDSSPASVTQFLWQKLLDQAAREYYNQHPAQAIAHYQIALMVAERLSNKRCLAIT